MTKTGKLFGSIAILLFIALMIPVAIFATRTSTFNNKSYVRFNVLDLQGDFYISMLGNGPSQNPSVESSKDIGTLSGNVLKPDLLFNARYDETTGDYQVFLKDSATPFNDNNNEIKPIEFAGCANVNLDEEHKIISYYFVYVNTAENTIDQNTLQPIDNRNVVLTTSTNFGLNFPSLNNENPDSGFVKIVWSYALGTINDTTYNSANPKQFTIPANWDDTPLVNKNGFDASNSNILVKAKENSNYNYAIIKFDLIVNDEIKTDIDTAITLNITISSEVEANNEQGEGND